jgi:hypothetical protein
MRFLLTVVSIALLITFAVSGHSLFRYNPALGDVPALRFTLRGHHIYILLMGLSILCLGRYFREHETLWIKCVQWLAGVVLVGSALSVAITFFGQDAHVDSRPVTNISLKLFAYASIALALTAPRRQST